MTRHHFVPALVFVFALVPSFAPAQSSEAPLDEQSDLSLIEEGARLFLEGVLKEMTPAIEGLESLVEELGPNFESLILEMGPALRELLEMVDSFAHYHPPEFQPNGDIILRRKDDAPQFEPPEDDPSSESIEI